MTTGDQAGRTSGWEVMQRNLAAEAGVAEALLYASGGRRLTVEHGQPLTKQASALVQQLVDHVDQAVEDAGCLGSGTVIDRPTSITWTFPSTDVPARLVAGGWIVNADDHPPTPIDVAQGLDS